MKKTIISVWSLLLGMFLMTTASSLLTNVISLRASAEGFSSGTIGIIMSSFYLGYCIGALYIPKFIRHVGYIRVFAALMSVVSLAALIFPIYVDSFIWIIARTLLGFCIAGLFLVAESWLNSQSNNETRAQILAIYAIAIFSGLALGAKLIHFWKIEDFLPFAIASIIFSIGAIPLLITNIEAPPTPIESARMGVKQLYSISPLGTFSVAMSNLTIAVVLSLASIYGKQSGMSNETISTFVSLNILVSIFTQFPIGRLSDSMDRRFVIILTTFISFILAVYTAFQAETNSIIWLFALIGGMVMPQYSLAVAYINDRLTLDEVLPASSAIILVSGIGATIGPLITGYFMDWFGKESFFITIAISSLSVTIFSIIRKIKRPENVHSDDNYSPIAVNASAVSVMQEDILDVEKFENHTNENE